MSHQHSTGRDSDTGAGRPRFGKSEQEVVVGAVLLVAFLYLRLNLTGFVLGRRGAAYVDPDFWPGWLLNAAIVFALAYLVQMLMTVRRERSEAVSGPVALAEDADTAPAADGAVAAEGEEVEQAGVHTVAISKSTPKLFAGFALLWAYIYAMRFIGFVPSTFIFCIVFLLFVGERRWKPIALFPIGLTGVLIYIFTRLLVVPLPRGSGFFLDLSTYFY